MCLSRRLCLLAALLSLAFPLVRPVSAYAADADEETASSAAALTASLPTTRTIHGTVLSPDGKPLAGADVRLVLLMPHDVVPYATAGDRKGWHWITDPNGRFEVRLNGEPTRSAATLPCAGFYHLVVAPGADHAGGVSPGFGNPSWEREMNLTNGLHAPNEWGENHLVLSGENGIVARTRKGIPVQVRVVDADGAPFENAQVTLFNDLHAPTHTGYGGEIIEYKGKTDSEGRLAFPNLYPASITIFGPDNWFRTRIGTDGAWQDDRVDHIPVNTDATKADVEIMAARKPCFRYFGQVTGLDGKPVGGAQITLSTSRYATEGQWQIGQRTKATTAEDGSYEVMGCTPWANWIEARKDKLVGRNDPEGEPNLAPPGRYDIRLTTNTQPWE